MRSLETRCKEHRDAIRLAQCTKSAVADHVLSEEHSQPHEIDWQSVRILGRAQRITERRMKEAMLIYPKMNRDIADGTKLSLEFCSVNLRVSSFHQSFVPLI